MGQFRTNIYKNYLQLLMGLRIRMVWVELRFVHFLSDF